MGRYIYMVIRAFKEVHSDVHEVRYFIDGTVGWVARKNFLNIYLTTAFNQSCLLYTYHIISGNSSIFIYKIFRNIIEKTKNSTDCDFSNVTSAMLVTA